jgi:hypothetical protein
MQWDFNLCNLSFHFCIFNKWHWCAIIDLEVAIMSEILEKIEELYGSGAAMAVADLLRAYEVIEDE